MRNGELWQDSGVVESSPTNQPTEETQIMTIQLSRRALTAMRGYATGLAYDEATSDAEVAAIIAAKKAKFKK